MDEQESRKRQVEWDERSLEKRVKRWTEIVPATYNVPLPDLTWQYLTEADEMYIDGHFIGVISICGSIAELLLADRVISKSQMTQKESERFSFEQLVILGRRLGVLTPEQASQLNGLRKLRNSLVHSKAGKLAEMGKQRFRVFGADGSVLNVSNLYADLYIKPLGEGGIDKDALKYLKLVRDLAVKFYSTDE